MVVILLWSVSWMNVHLSQTRQSLISKATSSTLLQGLIWLENLYTCDKLLLLHFWHILVPLYRLVRLRFLLLIAFLCEAEPRILSRLVYPHSWLEWWKQR